MVHNYCGEGTNASCMVKGRCKFGYPKQFQQETVMLANGSPLYARPNNKIFAKVRSQTGGPDQTVDNTRIVPYSPYLLRRYQCHINVESVGSINSPKYLFGYMTKGIDHILFCINTPRYDQQSDEPLKEIDEIKVCFKYNSL